MIFTTQQTDAEQVKQLRERGAEVMVVGEHRVDLMATLGYLKSHGVERLLVEGGGMLNAELLKQRLVDELYVYIAPLIFAGATAPTFADGLGLERAEAIRLERLRVETWDDGGIVVSYTVPKD